MPSDIRHFAVVGSRTTKPSVTNAFERALGSSHRNISGPYDYREPSFKSNPPSFVNNPSNVNTLSGSTSPFTVLMSIFTVSRFSRYLHHVRAARSPFVSLPFFIGLETVVNRIKIWSAVSSSHSNSSSTSSLLVYNTTTTNSLSSTLHQGSGFGENSCNTFRVAFMYVFLSIKFDLSNLF
jgi:hypothetical protein